MKHCRSAALDTIGIVEDSEVDHRQPDAFFSSLHTFYESHQ